MKDFQAIIKELKEYLLKEKKSKVLDKDVALLLDINQARFATIKKRNVTPYEDILLFCEKEHMDANVLFFKQNI